jgi:hypothetical protein
MTSATLEKPLTRESLVNPDAHLSTPEGSGLFAAQTPRLPRIHANRVFSSPSGELLSIRFNYKPRFRRLSTIRDRKSLQNLLVANQLQKAAGAFGSQDRTTLFDPPFAVLIGAIQLVLYTSVIAMYSV